MNQSQPQKPILTPQMQRNRKIVHYSAIGTLFVAPAIAFMPPRKIDFFTYGLGFSWLIALNYLAVEDNGRDLVDRIAYRLPQILSDETVQKMKREEEELGNLTPSEYITKQVSEVFSKDKQGGISKEISDSERKLRRNRRRDEVEDDEENVKSPGLVESVSIMNAIRTDEEKRLEKRVLQDRSKEEQGADPDAAPVPMKEFEAEQAKAEKPVWKFW